MLHQRSALQQGARTLQRSVINATVPPRVQAATLRSSNDVLRRAATESAGHAVELRVRSLEYLEYPLSTRVPVRKAWAN